MIELSSTDYLAYALILLCIFMLILFVYSEIMRKKYDEQITYFVNLIDNKPEKDQEKIMKTLIIGLALSKSSERRLLKIITDVKEWTFYV